MGLKQTSITIVSYAIFLFGAFLVTGSIMLLGGVVGISVIAIRFYIGYRRRIEKEEAGKKDTIGIQKTETINYKTL